MTALEYGDDILVIDGGLAFPTMDMPGIDLVVPDYTYLKDNKDKIRGFVITHGHEDHIGGLPFILHDVPTMVYATKLTLALIEHKLSEHDIQDVSLIPVQYGDMMKIGCFKVEFIKVNHSITGAVSLAIDTPEGLVFHTGDYKIDFTPIDNVRMDLGQFARVGNKGVLLMLGESTNVEREGYSMSERTVGEALDKIFAQNLTRRIIISTFASNVHRVQQIMDLASKYNRRVALSGRSMENITEMAVKIGELKLPSPLVNIGKIKEIPDERLVIICTGSQGEPMSALTRMANDNSKIKIGENDTIILSASPIPGNEKPVYNVINNLYRKGARVIYHALSEVHVSGHACREELKTMFSLIKPKYFIPVHGEYRHLKQHAELAQSLGMSEANILVPELGDIVEVSKKGLVVRDKAPAGQLLVDGENIGDKTEVTLRDRVHLAEDGLMVVVVNISMDAKELSSEPDLICRGFTLDEGMEEEIKKIIESVMKKVGKQLDEREEIKSAVRKAVKKYVFKIMRRAPLIMPVVIIH
ncbi:MAG: ribonuclease J [Clostridia bacterium]|nr:ribonuclease J [Clostridia bacterium]